MRAKTTIGLLLTTAALGVAACGDDEGGSGGGGEALSREEYVKQANTICRESNAAIKKIPEPQSAEELGTYVDQAKNQTSRALDRFEALNPPEELQADHEAYVADGREVIGLADRLKAAAQSGNEQELQKLSQEGDKLDKESDDLANRMGLTDCASDS